MSGMPCTESILSNLGITVEGRVGLFQLRGIWNNDRLLLRDIQKFVVDHKSQYGWFSMVTLAFRSCVVVLEDSWVLQLDT